MRGHDRGTWDLGWLVEPGRRQGLGQPGRRPLIDDQDLGLGQVPDLLDIGLAGGLGAAGGETGDPPGAVVGGLGADSGEAALDQGVAALQAVVGGGRARADVGAGMEGWSSR